MNKADVLQAVFDMARICDSASAEDSLERIAALVADLDPGRPTYLREMESLLSIGAYICRVRQADIRSMH